MEALKAKEVKRVFRAWVEDWEKGCIKDKDAVAEIRLLEKYKGLAFFDTEENITYTIEAKNLEWYKSSKQKGIDGGWYIVATTDEEEVESFMIEDELCRQIAETSQEDGVDIIRREVEEEGNEG